MNRSFLNILLLVFIAVNNFGQTKNDETVASVNNEKITAGDFRLRFELSPYLSKKFDIYQADSLKTDFLYSLIAEKLWALESQKEGFAQTPQYRFLIQPLRDMFLRDGLYKEAVESKVRVTEKDIEKGIRLYGLTISANVISSNDSAIVFNAYNFLKKSINPDSALSSNESLKSLVSKVEHIKFGSLRNEALEDMVFSLKKGEFSKPMKQEALWFIFLIKDRISEPFDLTDQKTVNDMKSRIKDRRLEKQNKMFLDSLLSGKKYEVNKENFLAAAEKIIELINQDTTGRKDYFLSEWQYNYLLNSTGEDFLKKVLFSTDKKDFTIFDFLSSLAFDDFKTNSPGREVVLNELHKKINIYIPREILVEEALKRNIQNYPSVKSDISTWEGHYLSNIYRLSFKDSVIVTDDDVYNYFLGEAGAGKMKMLNLAVISTPDLNLIEDVLNKLKEGKDFLELASQFGKSDPAVDEKGLTGIVPSIQLGDLGSAADRLKEGEIYGPIKRSDGYSLFKVIEKKNSSDSVKIDFENVKAAMQNELYNKRINDFLTHKTAGFVQKYKVTINSGVLKGIEINSVPMFVHRMMGFGGRIAGVPFTTEFSDWVKEVEKSKLYP